jgi:hypothetical protein
MLSSSSRDAYKVNSTLYFSVVDLVSNGANFMFPIAPGFGLKGSNGVAVPSFFILSDIRN